MNVTNLMFIYYFMGLQQANTNRPTSDVASWAFSSRKSASSAQANKQHILKLAKKLIASQMLWIHSIPWQQQQQQNNNFNLPQQKFNVKKINKHNIL